MSRSTMDLWVGLFVAVGIGAILFLALRVGNLVAFNSAPGYRILANFDNIGGLKLRAPVKAAGVVVGRVEAIRLDPKSYDAVVTMRIEPGYEFTTDTIASILTSGLLGEVYIGLDAGGDSKMIADGGRVRKTQSAMVIEKLISQFMFDKASSPPATGPAPAGGSAVPPAPAPATATPPQGSAAGGGASVGASK